ncbi:hypothetical protein [Pedobacter cryoconitis]|uniref:hypothetical protein n=1 Tax=Pedobacter cryoconitis TaxID=188932 RepID=UPI001621ADCA|nr:hypothetical protein [Pedobacter cryoconitis]MBB5645639.1 hypothetical protein [Pedobacter cryoconitis]
MSDKSKKNNLNLSEISLTPEPQEAVENILPEVENENSDENSGKILPPVLRGSGRKGG